MTGTPGEVPAISERLLLSPVAGTLERSDGLLVGSAVHVGDVIGWVTGPGQRVPVKSSFAGELLGHLALAGHRVRPGQPVAWLRSGPGAAGRRESN